MKVQSPARAAAIIILIAAFIYIFFKLAPPGIGAAEKKKRGVKGGSIAWC